VSAPVPTLRIDATGTAFGTAPTYTDRTSYLMTGPQYPVDITFGRQDEQSEPQPSTCSFYLSNADGYWTPGAGVGPAGWDIGCPVNMRLTANAVTYDRFTGFVDSIEPTWPGGVQSWSVVKVTATDVSARLGIAKPLRSLLEYEILADSPDYFYTLGEAAGAASASDISTNARAAGTFRSSQGTSTVRFGVATDLVGPLTGLELDSPGAGAGPSSSLGLTVLDLGDDARPPAAGPYTWEVWFSSSLTPSVRSVLWSASTADMLGTCFLYLDTNGLGWGVYTATDNVTVSTNAVANAKTVNDGNMHQAAGVLSTDGKTAKIYFDGQLIQSTTAGTVLTATKVSNFLGGVITASNGQTGQGFSGVLVAAAQFNSELSAARILAHYQAGAGTNTESSDARFGRIAGYGGITTSGLPTGVATMGAQATSGATALEALKKVARTEGSFAFVTQAGALTFQGRQQRYHEAVGLTLAASDIAPPPIRRDRQGIANEITVTREGGASQTVVDSTSQTAIGRFDGGSFEVSPSTDDDALQSANWQVQNRKTTRTRLPDLTVDLYRQTSTTVVAQCLSATISTKAQVTGLPANAPASTMTLFVEGYTETIGYDRWSMSFYTSPIGLEDSVLILDDATYGALDTYRLAF
jgi:hypothetical protein